MAISRTTIPSYHQACEGDIISDLEQQDSSRTFRCEHEQDFVQVVPLATINGDSKNNCNHDTLHRSLISNRWCVFFVSILVVVGVAVLSVDDRISLSTRVMQMGVISGKSPSATTSASDGKENANDNLERTRKVRTTIANSARERLNSNLRHIPHKECVVTVLIARHCNDYGLYARDDDEEGDKHCSHMGYQRTIYFAQQFERSANIVQKHRRWPTPSAMYALLPDFESQTGGINYRQIEMLLPLANKTNVGIHVVSTSEQVADSIFRRLQGVTDVHVEEGRKQEPGDADVCGQVFVIAWKHRFIPDVAASLGCGHDQGCKDSYPDGEFDFIWQLRFVHEPPAPQNVVANLLDEDSSLIKDEYNLLKDQRLKQEQLGYPASDFSKIFNATVNIGWEVYGGVVEQHFDPLSYEYHPDLP